jgi:hypothetical protein
MKFQANVRGSRVKSNALPVILFIALITGLLLMSACSTPSKLSGTKTPEWCTQGTQFSKGDLEAQIQGFEVYRDTRYCKAIAQGVQGAYTLYFNKDASDVWMVIGGGDSKIETRLS